jgi:hypothetical protein
VPTFRHASDMSSSNFLVAIPQTFLSQITTVTLSSCLRFYLASLELKMTFRG